MLPPYAREIANARADRRHPEMILITIAPRSNWTKINDHRYPFVFVPEDEYLRGRYEFWFVAGVAVTLYAESTETETWLQLAAELGSVTAPVGVHSVYFEGTEIDSIMLRIKAGQWLEDAWWVDLDPVTGWPQWWSDERDQKYWRMREAWAADRRALGVAS